MIRKIVLSLILSLNAVVFYPNLFVSEGRTENYTAEGVVVQGSLIQTAINHFGLKLLKDWELNHPILAEIPSGHVFVKAFYGPDNQDPLEQYHHLVLPLSQKYGVDWRLVAAVIKVESNFDAHATSPVGAMGLMQLMPSTAAMYHVKTHDLYDPARNLEAGVQHLK